MVLLNAILFAALSQQILGQYGPENNKRNYKNAYLRKRARLTGDYFSDEQSDYIPQLIHYPEYTEQHYGLRRSMPTKIRTKDFKIHPRLKASRLRNKENVSIKNKNDFHKLDYSNILYDGSIGSIQDMSKLPAGHWDETLVQSPGGMKYWQYGSEPIQRSMKLKFQIPRVSNCLTGILKDPVIKKLLESLNYCSKPLKVTPYQPPGEVIPKPQEHEEYPEDEKPEEISETHRHKDLNDGKQGKIPEPTKNAKRQKTKKSQPEPESEEIKGGTRAASKTKHRLPKIPIQFQEPSESEEEKETTTQKPKRKRRPHKSKLTKDLAPLDEQSSEEEDITQKPHKTHIKRPQKIEQSEPEGEQSVEENETPKKVRKTKTPKRKPDVSVEENPEEEYPSQEIVPKPHKQTKPGKYPTKIEEPKENERQDTEEYIDPIEKPKKNRRKLKRPTIKKAEDPNEQESSLDLDKIPTEKPRKIHKHKKRPHKKPKPEGESSEEVTDDIVTQNPKNNRKSPKSYGPSKEMLDPTEDPFIKKEIINPKIKIGKVPKHVKRPQRKENPEDVEESQEIEPKKNKKDRKKPNKNKVPKEVTPEEEEMSSEEEPTEKPQVPERPHRQPKVSKEDNESPELEEELKPKSKNNRKTRKPKVAKDIEPEIEELPPQEETERSRKVPGNSHRLPKTPKDDEELDEEEASKKKNRRPRKPKVVEATEPEIEELPSQEEPESHHKAPGRPQRLPKTPKEDNKPPEFDEEEIPKKKNRKRKPKIVKDIAPEIEEIPSQEENKSHHKVPGRPQRLPKTRKDDEEPPELDEEEPSKKKNRRPRKPKVVGDIEPEIEELPSQEETETHHKVPGRPQRLPKTPKEDNEPPELDEEVPKKINRKQRKTKMVEDIQPEIEELPSQEETEELRKIPGRSRGLPKTPKEDRESPELHEEEPQKKNRKQRKPKVINDISPELEEQSEEVTKKPRKKIVRVPERKGEHVPEMEAIPEEKKEVPKKSNELSRQSEVEEISDEEYTSKQIKEQKKNPQKNPELVGEPSYPDHEEEDVPQYDKKDVDYGLTKPPKLGPSISAETRIGTGSTETTTLAPVTVPEEDLSFEKDPKEKISEIPEENRIISDEPNYLMEVPKDLAKIVASEGAKNHDPPCRKLIFSIRSQLAKLRKKGHKFHGMHGNLEKGTHHHGSKPNWTTNGEHPSTRKSLPIQRSFQEEEEGFWGGSPEYLNEQEEGADEDIPAPRINKISQYIQKRLKYLRHLDNEKPFVGKDLKRNSLKHGKSYLKEVKNWSFDNEVHPKDFGKRIARIRSPKYFIQNKIRDPESGENWSSEEPLPMEDGSNYAGGRNVHTKQLKTFHYGNSDPANMGLIYGNSKKSQVPTKIFFKNKIKSPKWIHSSNWNIVPRSGKEFYSQYSLPEIHHTMIQPLIHGKKRWKQLYKSPKNSIN